MNLERCPPASPLPAQTHILRVCAYEASVAGLQLPARIDVQWRLGRPGSTPRGRVEWQDGRARLFLDANMAPPELREVAFHELQHLADFATAEGRALTEAEREKRAIQFAARMMGWR